ncbi:hypothetical protein SNE26_07315 [Mucilaginibacter sp. cycad4]|uniref:hypothetical protein n=1 Tax=Mucilaginibacter sp. cycad4 TaxID=3342096 RepID=UPI002AAB8435|nr:hypothetical protein [Mucilaginibacter gossypii]WPV01581.1 hypothetical protein SNE26_07315 [Mucilaginibacter gossypii]
MELLINGLSNQVIDKQNPREISLHYTRMTYDPQGKQIVLLLFNQAKATIHC